MINRDVSLDSAYRFARTKHQNQIRQDGSRYINHPILVRQLVEKFFASDNKLNELEIAAYLHDTVEDTDTTIEEIKSLFGSYIAYLVAGVTNDNILIHKIGKTSYLCNKLVNMTDDVLNLKLCDRLANILDLINAPFDFQEKYSNETVIILNYLLDNRRITNTQRKIINDIYKNINRLNEAKVLILTR